MRTAALTACLVVTFSLGASAVTEDDFEVETTRNLLNLCTVPADHAHAQAAIHFCHGFLVGAYDYHEASSGPSRPQLVCFPENAPSRDAIIQMFVEWAQAHPQFMTERPVQTEFRFLIEKYPCK